MSYGAAGNGSTLDSPSINNAIAAVSGSATASGSGPGLVYFPAGTYLSETIHMGSNAILYLAPGAVIKGNTGGYDVREYYPNDSPWAEYQDYGHTYFKDALITGSGLNNIGIEGPGEITGNGHLSTSVNSDSQYTPGEGDKDLCLVLCSNVTLTDGTITSSGHFGILAQGCTNFYMNNFHIMSSNYRDAFNLIACSHVLITNSLIQGSDDSMCLKSTYALGYALNCSDIRVDHCWILSTENNAIQFGSETVGNFTDCMFTNDLLTGAGKAGMGITSNDGSIIDGVTFCGITETNCAAPIFLKLSLRNGTPGSPTPHVGRIQNISYLDTTSSHAAYFNYAHASAIFGYPSTSGSPAIPITNVVMDNVIVTNTGGAPASQANSFPVDSDDISNVWLPQDLDPYPSYGWFLRHVNGVAWIGSSGTTAGWTPTFPAMAGSYPGISGTWPGWSGVIPDYTSTNCQTHEDNPDGRPAIQDDLDGTNIKFDGLVADVNTSGTNNSVYDAEYYNTTGYQMTGCSGTTPLFEEPAMSGTMALRVTATDSSAGTVVFPPTYSPITGNYSTPQTVSLSCETPGATIRYTTDDSEPSETHGTVYTGPISVTNYAAIRAIAYDSGMTDSAVNTSIYAITSAAPAPAFTPAGGTYTSPPTVTITSLATLTTSGTIRYTTDGSTPSETNGTVFVNPITVTSTTAIQAIAYGPGLTDSPIVSATYNVALSAAAPVFNPPGGTYSTGQSVMMDSTTPNASIYYTTNGSTPTQSNGTLYSQPVVVNDNTTLEAVAYANTFAASTVTSAAYVITSGTTYEAVDLSATTQGASEVEQSDDTIGNWEALEATGTGQWIQYTIPGLPAGSYDFQMEWKGNTERGILNETFDGTLLSGSSDEFSGGSSTYSSSTSLDQYTSGQSYWMTDYGTIMATGTGNHLVRQTVIGENPDATGYWLSAAAFYFTPYPPSISSIANQSINMNESTGAIPFTIGDGNGPISSLSLSATSSSSGLVPAGGITFSGTGASQTVTVTPMANLSGTAQVTVTVSNGSQIADSSFNVAVTPSALQSWRLEYFGTASNSGNAADTADPAGDGLSNLEKYVLNLNPNEPQVATFTPAVQGSNFTLTYTRSDAAASEITVQCQWATNPAGPWSGSGITEQILSDNGTIQTVRDSVPMNGAARIFFQLQLTDP